MGSRHCWLCTGGTLVGPGGIWATHWLCNTTLPANSRGRAHSRYAFLHYRGSQGSTLLRCSSEGISLCSLSSGSATCTGMHNMEAQAPTLCACQPGKV